MGKKYEHLSIEERAMIQLGLEQRATLAEHHHTGVGAQWLDLSGSPADKARASACGGRLSGCRR